MENSVNSIEFLREENILIPIKCDITFGGARFVDSLSWNLFNSMMTPNEFAARTCADLNLAAGFQNRIAIQITEQVAAYRELVSALKMYCNTPSWNEKFEEPQVINVGIRHNTLDYSDKFWWSMASDMSPEEFSRKTCSDLGLPGDMEAVISHKIRETLFRTLCSWIEEPGAVLSNRETPLASEIKLYMASQYSSIEMMTNLWKRAKPATADDIASVAQPTLPQDKDTNANIWNKK